MVIRHSDKVKLTETDFLILDKLREGRNIAANIAVEIDRSRGYLNNKMGYLVDYDLVRKVGPVEDSGLYELTDRGRLAYEHRDKYFDDDVDFGEFLDERLGESED